MLIEFSLLVFTISWESVLCVLHLLSPPRNLLDTGLVLLRGNLELLESSFSNRFMLDFNHLIDHSKFIINIPNDRLAFMLKNSFIFMDSGFSLFDLLDLVLEIFDILLIILSNLNL